MLRQEGKVNIFDADSHMIEPPLLWAERLDTKFRDRAPRAIKDYDRRKGTFFLCEDAPPLRMAPLYAAGQTFDRSFLEAGLDSCPAGGYDPAARLKDMDRDGVAAQALYTSVGFSLFGIKDADLQEACFRVYNDWLAEFCKAAPDRFAGLAMISLYNVDSAARELERCRKLGLRGAMIWSQAPLSQPYKSPMYDRFWAAAQELDMPLALHEATGQRTESRLGTLTDAVDTFQRIIMVVHEIELTVIELIFSGVLERFPRLKVICTEVEIGWVAPLFARIDKYYRRFSKTIETPLRMKPSDYFRRQIYATFIDDSFGVKTYDEIGADNFLWSTDYPHQASTWPHTREAMAQTFATVPEADLRKIVNENTARLYNLGLR
jgi:predicted TIM-barrel fold metal-dependent hydrolase